MIHQRSFGRHWGSGDNEAEQDAVMDDLLSAMIFILLIIVVALLVLFSKGEAGGGPASSWAPGIALRFEARSGYGQEGGYVREGQCPREIDGHWLGDLSHFVEGTPFIKEEYREIYLKRPVECIIVDQDLYARYTTPDGTVYDVLSLDSPNKLPSAEGAFAYSVPAYLNSNPTHGRPFTPRRSGDGYNSAPLYQPMRTEEMTYRHKFLAPGHYSFNIVLDESFQDMLWKMQFPGYNFKPAMPTWPVSFEVYLVVFEGTDQETVLFNDIVTFTSLDDMLERTVLSFEVDENGKIIPDSIDRETQVSIKPLIQ